tara:strand:- start:929 stop:1756 length:828 start_codon:yes stop_codon:yes gene_type:complete
MSNIIKQKLKHGFFSYYSNDQYIGKSLSEYGEWSEAEVILLTQLLSTNENIIEVGSNIGTHTIPLAKQVSNGGLVYAIEPQYQNHKLLLKNIKDNDLKNVEIIKVAISSKQGEAYMNTFDENVTSNYGDSKIFNSNFENAESVPVKTLDQLFYNEVREKKSIKLIKCDAQGQELNIILGSRKIIDMHKPFLYLENDDIDTSKSLIEEIKKMGYIIFWHLPPLFNPNNFLKNNKNIFKNIISYNMFCIHHASKVKLNNQWKKLEITDSSYHPLKKR